MKALTMNMPLMLSSLTVKPDRPHCDQGIISRFAQGGLHRRPRANAHKRLRRLAGTLVARSARPRNETNPEQHAWI
jgi:hypothetical protein